MIIDPTFITHWKTQLVRQKLGDAGVIYVLALWSYCQTSRKSTLDIPHAAIAAICGYKGDDPETLISSLVDCRFLDRNGDRLSVHEWSEYNGKLISNWENGRRGGRPRAGTHTEQANNPSETQNGIGLTQSKPTANPHGTDAEPADNPCIPPEEPTRNRLEKSRDDKIGEEPAPPMAPRGGGAGKDDEAELLPDPETKTPKAADDAWRKQVASRLNAIFSRRDTTRWSDREAKAMRRIWPISDDDLSLIEIYYQAPIPNDRDFRRRDLLTLLNNWQGEIDRARKVLADLSSHSDKRSTSVKTYLTGSWDEAAERAKE